MRVNIYAEEMTDRMEIIGKEIDGHTFTGLRFYLELPCTIPNPSYSPIRAGSPETVNVSGPFMHRPGDDDSAAVTFWGKRDLREVLKKALAMLDEHYAQYDAARVHKCAMCGYTGPDTDHIGQCPQCNWDELQPMPAKAAG